MSATEFIRLKKANCTNCYKCIRHCPVKAIRFSGGQAHIIQDACIYCGECFVICPQNAKWIYSETELVKSILLQNEVYVSLAPSFVSYFDTGISCMKDALKKLGFAGCEETAVGATIVKNAYEQLIQEGKKDVLISSCCHTVNLLIQKYYPDLLDCLAPVVSPMQAHCRKLKQEHPGCKTVFIGPCISKKDEAERYMEDVDAVMTFDELEAWFNEEKIVIPKDFEACEMSKTRLFPKAGGILKTMAKDQPEYVYLSVDGTEQCMAYLEDIRHGNIHHCFIEMSACKGSCIGGPLMIKRKEKILERNLQIERYAGEKDFVVAQPDENTIRKDFENLEYSTFIPVILLVVLSYTIDTVYVCFKSIPLVSVVGANEPSFGCSCTTMSWPSEELALFDFTSCIIDFTIVPFCLPSYFTNLLLKDVSSASVIPLFVTVSCAWLNIMIPNEINRIANKIAPAIINAFEAFSI